MARDYSAAAKSLQSCPTLCNPMDCSLPGFSIHGILQARTLEWVAISFSNAWKWKVKVKSLSHVRLLATPWTAAYQAPPSMGFSRQQYWSGVPLPSPRDNATEPQRYRTFLSLHKVLLDSTALEHWPWVRHCGSFTVWLHLNPYLLLSPLYRWQNEVFKSVSGGASWLQSSHSSALHLFSEKRRTLESILGEGHSLALPHPSTHESVCQPCSAVVHGSLAGQDLDSPLKFLCWNPNPQWDSIRGSSLGR